MNSNADPTTGQARPPKPIPLPVIPEHIPDKLKAIDQWVCWRYRWDDDAEKWTKHPFFPRTGNMASSTDPKTWTSFDFACQRYLDSQSESWRFDGIGLVLTDKNGLVGFDLDHCRDPETGDIDQLARDIVQGLPTYWEVSPSGTGLRGFAFGRKPGSRCRSGDFEMYQSGRYLCISGHHLENTPQTIEAIQDGIDAVYTQIFPPKDTYAPGAHVNGTHLEYEDQLILEAARRARNGADFIALFDQGDIRRYHHDDGRPDFSRADAALCRLLAFYTKHEEQMDRLFRVSALNRPKWESRADYRSSTITFAIESTPDQWSGPSRNGQPHVSDEEEPTYHTSGVHSDSTITNQQKAPPPPEEQPAAKRFFRKKTFIPKRLGDCLLARFHIKYAAGMLWVYRNGVYVSDGERILAAAAQQLLGEDRRQNRIEETLRYIEVATYTEMPPPDLRDINLLNGRLEWATGTLHVHTPDIFSVMQLPVHYNQTATCPTFDQYLDTTLDKDVIPLVDEVIGDHLIPDTRYEKATMLTGEGGNGKSVFIDTLTSLLGSQHVSNIALQDLEENRFLAAELFGKLGNFFADLDPRALKTSSLFKTLVTGDEIQAERKFKDPFKFRNVARLLFSANKLPDSIDRTHAFYRRWHIIPFTKTFTAETRDTELRAKLVKELPGILNRAIRGLKRLTAQKGFTVPQAVKDELSKYERQNDSLAAFMEEAVDIGPTFSVPKQRFYQRYCRWCDVYRLRRVSQKELKPRLYKLLPTLDEARFDSKGVRGGKGPWRWIGMQPIDDGPDEDDG